MSELLSVRFRFVSVVPALFFVLLGIVTQSTLAGRVAPSERVVNWVNVREEPSNDGAYRINNASIVLMVEIDGLRFLFTGDANGKERDEPSPGTPGHVEQLLLALEEEHPGVLRADVLKVPHHGSETAGTQAFIDRVDPQYAIISAGTRHHLPRPTVIERYGDGTRVVLRTDEERLNDNDHIVCYPDAARRIQCNFADVLAEN